MATGHDDNTLMPHSPLAPPASSGTFAASPRSAYRFCFPSLSLDLPSSRSGGSSRSSFGRLISLLFSPSAARDVSLEGLVGSIDAAMKGLPSLAVDVDAKGGENVLERLGLDVDDLHCHVLEGFLNDGKGREGTGYRRYFNLKVMERYAFFAAAMICALLSAKAKESGDGRCTDRDDGKDSQGDDDGNIGVDEAESMDVSDVVPGTAKLLNAPEPALDPTLFIRACQSLEQYESVVAEAEKVEQQKVGSSGITIGAAALHGKSPHAKATALPSKAMSSTFRSYSKSLSLILYYLYESSPSFVRSKLLRSLVAALNSSVATLQRRTRGSASHHIVRVTTSSVFQPLLSVLSSVISGSRCPSFLSIVPSILLPLHHPMGFSIHRDQDTCIAPYHKLLTRCVVKAIEKGEGADGRKKVADQFVLAIVGR